MKKKEYVWECSFFGQMDANKVGKEIESLGDNVTSDMVVEKAKSIRSEMHNYFEWDDTIAGKKWRKQQADNLIRALRVTYITEDEKPVTVRAMINIKRGNGYESVETVVSDVEKYQLLLEKAYKELADIKNRYKQLTEIQELLAFLD